MGAVEHEAPRGVKRKSPVRVQHAILDGFLGDGPAADLLAGALAREGDFMRAEVTSDDEHRAIDLDARRSWVLRGGAGLLAPFEGRVRAIADTLLGVIGMGPLDGLILESSLCVHRDGDYFHRHIDLFAAARRRHATHDRIATLVWYLNARPKGFTGGELVLHPLLGDAPPTPIVPEHDRLVIFPAYLPHEVTEVTVPNDRFADARFSINCWLSRPRG